MLRPVFIAFDEVEPPQNRRSSWVAPKAKEPRRPSLFPSAAARKRASAASAAGLGEGRDEGGSTELAIIDPTLESSDAAPSVDTRLRRDSALRAIDSSRAHAVITI